MKLLDLLSYLHQNLGRGHVLEMGQLIAGPLAG